jgi:hypothetical protein
MFRDCIAELAAAAWGGRRTCGPSRPASLLAGLVASRNALLPLLPSERISTTCAGCWTACRTVRRMTPATRYEPARGATLRHTI